MTAYTSAVAYREHVIEGKATSQRQRILNLLLASEVPLSRAEIANYFKGTPFGDTWDFGPDIPLASVCGRLAALIESKQAIELDGLVIDPLTKHKVKVVVAVRPTPVQRSFEDFR